MVVKKNSKNSKVKKTQKVSKGKKVKGKNLKCLCCSLDFVKKNIVVVSLVLVIVVLLGLLCFSFMDNKSYGKDYKKDKSKDRDETRESVYFATSKEAFIHFSDELDLDEDEFTKCFDENRYYSDIDFQVAQFSSIGQFGTPTFLVNNQIIQGVTSYPDMKQIIDFELEGKSNDIEFTSLDSLEKNENLLLYVSSSDCYFCNDFLNSLKSQLVDFDFHTLNSEDVSVKKMLNDMGVKTLPVLLFSYDIENNTQLWGDLQGNLRPYDFENGKSYYVLSQGIPAFYLIEDVNLGISVFDNGAEVTLYEASDLECPYCAIAHGEETLTNNFKTQSPGFIEPIPKVYEEYMESGLINFNFINYPILTLHPNAKQAHNALMCANEQGKVYEYMEMLFQNRNDWLK